MPAWEFERDGEIVRVDPTPLLVARPGAAADLLLSAAIAGLGIVVLFEDPLRPALGAGTLVPVLEPWWQSFSGPYLYFPSRRLMPGPLRAFVDFVRR
jgi:DNA-binding transcriptional LysR family regulator